MKVLWLLLSLLSFSVNAGDFLVLNFENKGQKQEWINWYLDKNAEDHSGYYVREWDSFFFNMVQDGVQVKQIWDKSVKISDIVHVYCLSSRNLNHNICIETIKSCIDYLQYTKPDIAQKEIEILGRCLLVE